MFSIFLELVKKVGIFVIIGQTIMHFGIGKQYEKYMKLLMSFMVAAQVIFAFGIYFKHENESWNMMSAEEYMEAWDVCMRELEERIESSKGELEVGNQEFYEEIPIKDKQDMECVQIEKITIP